LCYGPLTLLFAIEAEWQLDGEGRAFADDAFDANATLVLLDDLPADAQAQAAAAMTVFIRLLGGIERLEDQPQLVGSNADAGVRDKNLDHLRRLVFPNFKSQPAAVRHRLAGIDDQIEKDLFDLAGDHRGSGPVVELGFHLDVVFAQVFSGQNEDFVNEAGDVDYLALRCVIASETEHAVDDGRGSLPAFENSFQCLGASALVLLRLQPDLGVIDDGGQDVVELVGDTGGEGAYAAETLGL